MTIHSTVSHARLLFLLFFSIILLSFVIGISKVNDSLNIINDGVDYHNYYRVFNQTINFIASGAYKIYNAIYYTIFNIPLVFWLLIVINLFLIYSLKLDNFKFTIENIFAFYFANNHLSIKQKYKSFQSFISSSYGALSVAAISEIIILLNNYNSPGSIFWMCLTIMLIGAIQLAEILLNCHYMKNTDNPSCFICVLQYVVNKYSLKNKNKSSTQLLMGFILIYSTLMILVSFFSTTLFQVEQFANLFYMNKYGSILLLMGLGAFLMLLFFVGSLNKFNKSMRFNFICVPPLALFYIAAISLFLIFHSEQTINICFKIIEDITNKDAILPGIASGLVISFARYIYKTRDYQEDDWEICEETNAQKSAIMYSLESLFMILLVALSGITFLLLNNFPEMSYFLGVNIKSLIFLSLIFFAFSVIINEALYSKIALAHLLKLSEDKINFIVRSFLISGIAMGLFRQTDQWVDIADHFSIIFLLINLLSFFFVKKEAEVSLNDYKQI